jgi:hypothetical protein
MIKFTIIFIVIYLVAEWFAKVYVRGLSALDKFRIGLQKYNKKETIFFAVLGIMKILTVIFGAISVIVLVLRWL